MIIPLVVWLDDGTELAGAPKTTEQAFGEICGTATL